MANYQLLKADIDKKVYQNGKQEITGENLNSVLNAMVTTLGEGYQFMGMATPTNPATAQTPDYKCFYLATTPGTYTNLGGLVVADGEVALLKYDSSWTKEVTGIATAAQLNQLGQELSADIASIDGTINLVGFLIKDSGIDEDGTKVTNNNRSIVFIRVAKDSPEITIECDKPIVSWNYYSGYPEISTGSNFMSPRVVTSATTRGVRDGASYIIIMLNTSDGYPTYIRASQSGNYKTQESINRMIINVSQLFPTGGIDGSNIYTKSGARAIVPESQRTKGTILVYNYANTILCEQYCWEYTDNTDWVYGNHWNLLNDKSILNLNALANVQSFNSRSDALDRVPEPLRIKGAIITYYLDNGGYTERFNGDVWTKSEASWDIIATTDEISNVATALATLNNKVGYDTNIKFVNFSYHTTSGSTEAGVSGIENIPSIPKKATLKVTGFDARVIFYDASYRNLGQYFTTDGVEQTIVLPATAAAIRIFKPDMSAFTESLNYDIKVYYSNEADKFVEYESLKHYADVRMILRNLVRTAIGANNAPDTTYKTLVLASITDIHNDVWCAQKFIELNKVMSPYISDLIGLGDYVAGSLASEYLLGNIAGFEKIIKTIGNHDAYENFPNPVIITEQQAYNRWLANEIANWGVQYQSNKCYFYKDYTDQHIRLIVLDYMHWDEANDADGQKAWFASILTSASESDLHVVIAIHSPIVTTGTGSVVPFDRFAFCEKDVELNIGFDAPSIPIMVDNFMQNGGEFICYLTGHRHFDFIGTYENYPNQIVITQCCTTGNTDGNDTEWSTECNWALRFNYYSFDYKKKFIRVYQHGTSFDRNMQHKVSALLTYDKTIQNKLLF